ncbi:hypothetical protein HBB16_01535 [Pseudonocardia sp. MCCB 268]|nr:hypothetical protein [Pseudonocardia cytotoxica]
MRLAAEAMAACMVEQAAYVWFAHEEMHSRPVSVDDLQRGRHARPGTACSSPTTCDAGVAWPAPTCVEQ